MANFNRWIIATRPWSLPASAMPALATISLLYFMQKTAVANFEIDWMLGILSIVGAMIFQASGNLISDYFDFKYHVDRKESFGSSHLLVEGVFQPKTILRFGLILLAIGIVLGIYIVMKSGYNLLWIGLIGVIGTYFYYRIKYVALGDVLIFIIYGQLIALGTAFATTKELVPLVLPFSMSIGFLIVNILHANNTRDIYFDSKANIKTSAMMMGLKASKIKYMVMEAASYITIVVLVCMGTLNIICLSVLLTLPIAIKNIKQMNLAKKEEPERIKDLDSKSAQLVLIFSLLLSISNFIAPWI